eukprot:INCI6089.2.p1 GENE.INCI6089.2~~INCI6089.2.p1  ORF type:complete len:337 (-),score=64.07 INCI6089.2:1022-2032(-)
MSDELIKAYSKISDAHRNAKHPPSPAVHSHPDMPPVYAAISEIAEAYAMTRASPSAPAPHASSSSSSSATVAGAEPRQATGSGARNQGGHVSVPPVYAAIREIADAYAAHHRQRAQAQSRPLQQVQPPLQQRSTPLDGGRDPNDHLERAAAKGVSLPPVYAAIQEIAEAYMDKAQREVSMPPVYSAVQELALAYAAMRAKHADSSGQGNESSSYAAQLDDRDSSGEQGVSGSASRGDDDHAALAAARGVALPPVYAAIQEIASAYIETAAPKVGIPPVYAAIQHIAEAYHPVARQQSQLRTSTGVPALPEAVDDADDVVPPPLGDSFEPELPPPEQ